MNSFKGRERAVGECKRLRSFGMCPRQCASWRTHSRKRPPDFCKEAESAERRRK